MVSPEPAVVVVTSVVDGAELDGELEEVGAELLLAPPLSSVVDGALVRGTVVTVGPFDDVTLPVEPDVETEAGASEDDVVTTEVAVVVTSSVGCGPSTELMLTVADSGGAVSSLRRGSQSAGADD